MKNPKTSHNVDLSEIGECFYAWLDMLLNGTSVVFKGGYQDFPFITWPESPFKVSGQIGKSGTLQKINSTLGSDVLLKFEKKLTEIFKEKAQKLPNEIDLDLKSFLFQPDSPTKMTAFIHIRHQKKDQRDIQENDFKLIVSILEKEGFSHFILLGDLGNLPQNFKNFIQHNSKKYFELSYLEKGKYKKCLDDWIPKHKPIMKQIQLIRLIRQQYHVSLLIGRKSGAGLDMHAYAGMPTIFLDDDKNNDRYALPIKNNNNSLEVAWEAPYLRILLPVYFPTVLTPTSIKFFSPISYDDKFINKDIKSAIARLLPRSEKEQKNIEEQKKLLFSYIYQGNTSKVKELLSEDSRLFTVKNERGYTPLGWSIVYKRIEICKYFVAKMPPNVLNSIAYDHDKRTPLLLAAYSGASLIVDYFISVSGKKGETLLEEKDRLGFDILSTTALYGHINLMTHLLEKEFKNDTKLLHTKTGDWNALWSAVYGNKFSMVKHLYEIDPTLLLGKDSWGRNIIGLAKSYNCSNKLIDFLEEKLNISQEDNHNNSLRM